MDYENVNNQLEHMNNNLALKLNNHLFFKCKQSIDFKNVNNHLALNCKQLTVFENVTIS